MSITAPDDVDPAFREELRRAIINSGHGDTEVLDIRVAPTEDVSGASASPRYP